MSLAAADVLLGSFQGLTGGPGPITLSGARVGDRVYSAGITGTFEDDRGSFEKVISVDDEIQQTSGSPLSAYTFDVVLLRAIAVS